MPGPARPIDETVCTSLQAEFWLERLAAQRDCLRGRGARPLGRSRPLPCRDLRRRRSRSCATGSTEKPSDADTNAALRAAYPEYFDQPGASPNLLHQRFRRAREDVKALLQAVVQPRRTDLNSPDIRGVCQVRRRPGSSLSGRDLRRQK